MAVWAVSLLTYVELSPHSLTPMFLTTGIRSLIAESTNKGLYRIQCSTPRGNA